MRLSPRFLPWRKKRQNEGQERRASYFSFFLHSLNRLKPKFLLQRQMGVEKDVLFEFADLQFTKVRSAFQGNVVMPNRLFTCQRSEAVHAALLCPPTSRIPMAVVNLG